MVKTIFGKNQYLVQQKLDDIFDEYIKNGGESVERFDGSESEIVDSVIDAVRSVSFLDPNKLVIIKDFSHNKDIFARIEELVESTADSTTLVLVDPKLDKRTSGFKYLKANTELVECRELDEQSIASWLMDESKSMELKVDFNVIRYLVNRVGLNQQLLKSELDKLSLSGKDITKELIDSMIEETPQSKIFTMLDMLFSGRVEKAWSLYNDQRAQGEEPQKILAMIAWQLQQLALAMHVPDKNKQRLISDGMSPYGAQKALDMVKKIDEKQLEYMVTELARIDVMSKTNADIESAFAVYFSEVGNL